MPRLYSLDIYSIGDTKAQIWADFAEVEGFWCVGVVRKRATAGGNGQREPSLLSPIIQEDGDVVANVCLMELLRLARRAMLSLDNPTWCALVVKYQSELFVCDFNSEVFDVATGKAAATNETIARQTGPAYFH